MRGQIIRRARRRRGLSQAALAGLVGRSESWLSQVERGKRDIDAHSVLTRMAHVLRLDITDLTGTEAPDSEVRYTAAREIERAMMRYTSLETIVEESRGEHPIDVARLRAEADHTYAAYQATRYNEVGRWLPLVIWGNVGRYLLAESNATMRLGWA
nr:helix-turn-helix transcriptional regulator [Nocardiopsis mwathae]